MTVLPILVLEHEADSAPRLFGAWLDARGLPWEHRTLADGLPPDPAAYRAVVSLGSISSVNDADAWIAAELAFVQDAIARDVPVLGLCFGSQMLARAAGGTVYRAPEEEFGWVQPVGAPGPATDAPWFCWHGDAFTLPAAATLLAESPVSAQAFQLGRHVGFQFHPEVDEAAIHDWLEQRAQPHREPADLTSTIAALPTHLPGLDARAFVLFDWWLASAEPGDVALDVS